MNSNGLQQRRSYPAGNVGERCQGIAWDGGFASMCYMDCSDVDVTRRFLNTDPLRGSI